ncbi:unnamed protein product, partial [marine sediment metagenome]
IPTLLYDINKDTWSQIICDRLGIDITKLPEVRPSDEIIGRLSKQAAEETGLGAAVIVVTGGNDTACAALGMGVVEYGMAGDDSVTRATQRAGPKCRSFWEFIEN